MQHGGFESFRAPKADPSTINPEILPPKGGRRKSSSRFVTRRTETVGAEDISFRVTEKFKPTRHEAEPIVEPTPGIYPQVVVERPAVPEIISQPHDEDTVEAAESEGVYEITPPSVSSWSYIKGFKVHTDEKGNFMNAISWPIRILEVLEEMGAENIEMTESDENTITFSLPKLKGGRDAFEMNQSEVKQFLLDAVTVFEPSDFKQKKTETQGVPPHVSLPPHEAPPMSRKVEEAVEIPLPEKLAELVRQTAPAAREEKKKQGNSDARPIPSSVEAKPAIFDERFTKEFGITKEELGRIPGFEKLSLPQQKMVFENLVQSTYGRVDAESKLQEASRRDEQRAHAVDAYGRFAGNVWATLQSVFTKDFELRKTKQEKAHDFKTGGIEVHGDILKQLVSSMGLFGPRVHEDPATKELHVDLVHIDFDRTNRKAEFHAVQALNRAAHAFAKIPASWRQDTLGVDTGETPSKFTQFFKSKFSESFKHGQVFEESESQFKKAKELLEQTLRDSGKSSEEIASVLLGVDERVTQLQFIQTNPDAIGELARITDQNIYLESIKGMLGKSGLGYVAFGYVGRTALAGTLGLFAAPVVSSVIGGVRSWSTSASELRERDRNARQGVLDTSETALNVVSAHGLIKKTRALLTQYHELSLRIAEQKESGNAPKDLLAAYNTILSRLNERVNFIHDKQKLNKINYGSTTTYIGTQVELYSLMGEARMVLHNALLPQTREVIPEIGKRLEHNTIRERLDRYITYKEGLIEKKRAVYRREEVVKQTLKAGGFAAAGALLADFFNDAPKAKEFPKVAPVAEPLPETIPETPSLSETPNPPVAPEVPKPVEVTPPPKPEILPPTPEPIPQVPEVLPAEAPLEPHTVKRGDTLSEIMRDSIPRITEMRGYAQENAVANILLSLSESELKDIGVRSGNPDVIYRGDIINLEALNALVKAKEAIIQNAEKRF